MDGSEPHDHILLLGHARAAVSAVPVLTVGAGGGVPGVVGTGVLGGCYTGYYPVPSQDPYLVIFSL